MKIPKQDFLFNLLILFFGLISTVGVVLSNYQGPSLTSTISRAEEPLISNLRAENITANEVYIKWATKVSANSYVAYDIKNTSFGGSWESWGQWRVPFDNSYVTSHSVRIGSLQMATKYYVRVASKTQSGAFASSEIISFTTKTSPRFTYGPMLDYPFEPGKWSWGDYYALRARWSTDVMALYIEGFETEKSQLEKPDPQTWGSGKTWKGPANYDHTSPVIYRPKWNTTYYYRTAAKDPQTEKIVASKMFTVFLPAPTATPTSKPNCCGYHSVFKEWYCYPGCTGYTDITTVYPDRFCLTNQDCQPKP